ncbi:hypothetical protein H4R19_003161 [Coemansia spiralis]|nr:hypothetical protein H4R19_003161 [Coemansia spiralis]
MSTTTEPGMGPAGLKRFPTAHTVHAALVAANPGVARGGTDRNSNFARRVFGTLTRTGTGLVFPGFWSYPVNHLPLTPLLPTADFTLDSGSTPRPEDVRRWLREAEMGPDNAVTMAKLVFHPSYGQTICLDLDRQLEPGATFQWILLQGIVGPYGEVPFPMPRPVACLPTLDSTAALTLPVKIPYRNALKVEFAAIKQQWLPEVCSYNTAKHVVKLVEWVAQQELSDMVVTAEFYGSRVYGICKSSSDIDIIVDAKDRYGYGDPDIHLIGQILCKALRYEIGFSKVVWLSKTRFQGDIAINNELGRAKTRMLNAYMRMDSRVRTVMTLLKHWADRRQLTSSAALNSFGLMMMALAYLIDQQVVPPLQMLSTTNADDGCWSHIETELEQWQCPSFVYDTHVCLQTEQCLPSETIDGHECYFLDNPDELRAWRSPCKLPAYTLLFNMFRYYGAEFTPVDSAISPRLGRKSMPRSALHKMNVPLPQRFLGQPSRWHKDLRLLVIEDPFERTINCARNVPAEWVLGFQWEMRRAVWAMHRGLGSAKWALFTRLFLPPSPDIYSEAAIWAPVYWRLMKELANSGLTHSTDISWAIDLDGREKQQAGARLMGYC